MNYDNNMRGALFRNRDKKSDNSPDYTGKCEIEGSNYRIAAWIKTSNGGDKYMSLSFSIPRESANNSESQRADTNSTDDIPF